MESKEKIIIYQVLPRLFGNDNRTCQPWGSNQVNGCGHLADFTPRALEQIRSLGATHVWYTGLIEHASQTDYSLYGIAADHKAVVKGIAGSPYAIRDYYDIDPDLATSIPARMAEFEALVERTHAAGMKVLIDFVPNHVARQYHSDVRPDSISDLGQDDDTTQAFSPNNNFYYLPGQALQVQGIDQGDYREMPARATGNDQFTAQPNRDDWYETVKLNYGVDYLGGRTPHFDPVPRTWKMMLHILLYWASKGVDGFRCDMAEMVPVEFWKWAITQVKAQYPEVIFIAEIYNPQAYRTYIEQGHFDYLYDKVGMYDCLRAVTEGRQQASDITQQWQATDSIRDHMLYFLENHDEQRVASDFFAGDGEHGRAAMIVATCLGTNPVMLYFGQELGERGMDTEGFSGRDGRTTIFDYWMLDKIRRWRNHGRFDNRQLTPAELSLQQFYSRLLGLANSEAVLREGQMYDLMYANLRNPHFNPGKQFAFVRCLGQELILVVVNFDGTDAEVEVNVPKHFFEFFGLAETESVRAEGLLATCPFQISFTSEKPTRLLVPANSGRLLRFSL
ncbi:MAG: alpha-amylase [Bacteroidaceae bacterium]|nr:alpha-amylase [Bacteroidaceae bacterium]